MNGKKVAAAVGPSELWGGLTGALAALALARDGYQVDLFERRGDIREAEVVHGRSINLAISVRGLTGLQRVGLRERALEMAVPMRGALFLLLTDPA